MKSLCFKSILNFSSSDRFLFLRFSLLFTALFFLLSGVEAQKDPDVFLNKGEERPEVLLVGTFHFGYPNLDAYKVEEDKQVDILSPEKQKEVEELVDYIARFKPTKIVVEGGENTGYLLRRYEQWLANEKELRANEIDQLAFRLMKRFELDTLYGCDAWGVIKKMMESPDSTVFAPFLEDIFADYDWQSDEPMDARYNEWYDYQTDLSVTLPLLEYFKYLNDDKTIERMHGAYLIGDFKLEDGKGVDALTLLWYSRNLHIFRRIQQIEAGPDDRILVLFGAGHISILEQQFSASPEYKLLKFNDLD
jgi:hypothetical protein